MTAGSGSHTVLIVDDQPDIRLMCRVNLALEGYTVAEAGDGGAALEAARRDAPDLILLDVMMPGIDGWTALEALKADPATADIPVVLLTARVHRDDEMRGWRAGVADYLAKPFNPSTLTDVVRGALRGGTDERRRLALEKLAII